MDNNNKVFYNGSIWMSNNCGEFKIIGKSDRYRIYKNNTHVHIYYFCEFSDGTIVEAETTSIKRGNVGNPNIITLGGIGYIGQGKWKSSVKSKITKEYNLFSSIIERCYNPTSKSYRYYGLLGMTLCKELHNFQNFCDMLYSLENYEEWKNDSLMYWELDKDTLCDKLNIYPKVYSSKTCLFVTKSNNILEMQNRLYNKKHLATSPTGEQFIFTNITAFSKENNLTKSHVSDCLLGRASHHKKWTFINI